MRTRTASSLVLICAVAMAGTAVGQTVPERPVAAPGSLADWRSDLDQIVADIRLLHPDPFSKVGRSAFLREVQSFRDGMASMTPEQRVVRAMRLVASLGDGHTMLEPNDPAFAYWYPVRLYEFTDGLYVTSAHESVADLAGAKVLEIAGRPAAEAVEQARALIPTDNPYGRKERLWAVHAAALMKGLGHAGPAGELAVRFRLRDGRTTERTLIPSRTNHTRYGTADATFEWQYRPESFGLPFGADSQWVSAYKGLRASAFLTPDSARPAFLIDRGPYGARSLPAGDAYYIRTNQITDTDFVPFIQRAMRDVDQLRPRRLIIDWRLNFGGDASKMALVMQEFIKRTDDRPWKELYILTGRKTFSAAIMGLDALLENVPATIVGEPATAGLNHFGDPTTRPYPRTGMRLSVSTLRHQLSSSDDLAETVPVDVPAPFSFADYSAGRDPAVDAIVRGEEMRSIPVIARADGGGAARRAYLQRLTKFAGYDWWSPPKEIDLRHACDALREGGRTADALETCKLNAELHPDTWNVWYNLGIAQRAANLMKDRLESYRCVIEIEPNNWNVPALRRLLDANGGVDAIHTAPGCPIRR